MNYIFFFSLPFFSIVFLSLASNSFYIFQFILAFSFFHLFLSSSTCSFTFFRSSIFTSFSLFNSFYFTFSFFFLFNFSSEISFFPSFSSSAFSLTLPPFFINLGLFSNIYSLSRCFLLSFSFPVFFISVFLVSQYFLFKIFHNPISCHTNCHSPGIWNEFASGLPQIASCIYVTEITHPKASPAKCTHHSQTIVTNIRVVACRKKIVPGC